MAVLADVSAVQSHFQLLQRKTKNNKQTKEVTLLTSV